MVEDHTYGNNPLEISAVSFSVAHTLFQAVNPTLTPLTVHFVEAGVRPARRPTWDTGAAGSILWPSLKILQHDSRESSVALNTDTVTLTPTGPGAFASDRVNDTLHHSVLSDRHEAICPAAMCSGHTCGVAFAVFADACSLFGVF